MSRQRFFTTHGSIWRVAVVIILALACFGNSRAQAGSAAASGPDPVKALAALAHGTVFSTGPHGEVAASASVLTLTAAQLSAVKAMHATAAIALHYGGNDWSTAQVAGLTYEFAALGIKLIGVTDANFKPDKQVSDIQSLLAKKPSIIVSIPTDPVATASAYKAAAAQGVKLVFMDNVPNGMQAGKDYVSVVSADNCGNGIASAYLMAEKLHEQGKIALIFHAADFFVTKQRYVCFKRTIALYPGIHIVQEQGIAGPDFAGDAQKAAAAIITRHPDIDGIWAVWDVPAEGVLAALRSAGNQHILVTTEDLGLNVAVAIAKRDHVQGLGAQRPFDQGVNEAILGAYGLLKLKAPPYVALNPLPVDRSNVLQAWKMVYHANPPAALQSAYTSGN